MMKTYADFAWEQAAALLAIDSPTGFTEKANRALNSAIETAENLGHTYIGSEHLLLGL